MSESETDTESETEAIEVQEEHADDETSEDVDEAPIEVPEQEPAGTEVEAGTEAAPETRTVHPFFSVRGEPDGSVRARAGWQYDEGGIHNLAVNDTVGLGQAQLALDLAYQWYVDQLNMLAQQQAAEAEAEADEESEDGR